MIILHSTFIILKQTDKNNEHFLKIHLLFFLPRRKLEIKHQGLKHTQLSDHNALHESVSPFLCGNALSLTLWNVFWIPIPIAISFSFSFKWLLKTSSSNVIFSVEWGEMLRLCGRVFEEMFPQAAALRMSCGAFWVIQS